jgi:acetyl esterase
MCRRSFWSRLAPLASAVFFLMLSPLLSAAVQRDIEYSRVGDISLRMDASTPAGPGPHPAVILVHGGGWVSGDRARNVAPLFEPLEQAGFAWFSVSYRFATDFLMLGTAIDDVQDAIRFVRKNAAKYNVDPNRIALVGESAGAQLASMAAVRGTDDRESTVQAVVALYSPSDLVDLASTSPLISPKIREAVKGTVFSEMLLSYLRTLSPSFHVRPDLPPVLLMHGTADSVVPYQQSVNYCERLKKSGASCELVAIPEGGHGMRGWQSAGARNYRTQITEWLRRKLHAAPKPAPVD